MIRSIIEKSILLTVVWGVMIVHGGLVASAQNSSSSTTSAATPAPQQSASIQPAEGEAPKTPVTILEDTLIRVMTNESLNSKRAERGTPVLLTVSEDVFVGNVLAIPRGAPVHGEVVKSKKDGVLTGSPELTLKLVSLNLGGRSYPLDSYQFKVTGTSKTKPTETKALRGAEVGALLGSVSNPRMGRTVAGRAASMSTDAAIGAGVGALVSTVTPGPGIWIPSEAQVDFYLAAPVTVTPVSANEAARLAQGLHSGGPTLYVRGDTP